MSLVDYINAVQRLGLTLPHVTADVKALGESIDDTNLKSLASPPLADPGDGKGGLVVRDGTAPEVSASHIHSLFNRFEAVVKKSEEQMAAADAGERGPVTTESLLANPHITLELRRILETANLPGLGDQPGLGNDYALRLIEGFITNDRELRRADLSARERQDRALIRNELITFFGSNFGGMIEGFARELERLRAEAARPVTPSRTSATTRRTAGQSTGLRVGVLTGDLR